MGCIVSRTLPGSQQQNIKTGGQSTTTTTTTTNIAIVSGRPINSAQKREKHGRGKSGRESKVQPICEGNDCRKASNGKSSLVKRSITNSSSTSSSSFLSTPSTRLPLVVPSLPIGRNFRRQLFSRSSSSATTAIWHLFCAKRGAGASSDSEYSEFDLDRGHNWHHHSMFPMGIVSPPAKRTPSSRSKALHKFTIDTSRAKSNSPVVSFCARKLGIQEHQVAREDGQHCDIYWHSVVYPDMKSVVKAGARVNKFPGMTELAKKIALTQAIRSMRQLFPIEYSFYPQSWILPAQLAEFRQYSSKLDKCFIVKPDDGAQGTGIYLINSPSELQSVDVRQLVQEYVPDPYLLPDELKFDLRIYAVIRSINPLSIYVAREGMARFCTEKYPGKPNRDNFGNLYAHLTNYSLNKANNAYVHSKSLKEQLKGSKRLLSTVFHQMEHKGVKTRRLWREIKLIIVKTVLAMVPEMMVNYEHQFSESKGGAPQCFQIMGFDILVRKDGTPILLEVNSSPSLSVEHSLVTAESTESIQSGTSAAAAVGATDDPSPAMRSIVDEMIKVPLVRDSLLLVLDQLEQYYPAVVKERPMSRKDIISKENALKWDIQSLDSVATSVNCSVTTFPRKSTAEDDLGLLRRAKRPHLSEVFPARYGQSSRHLLLLDRAVYLYLQFVPIHQTLLISLPTIRAFLRKCELARHLSADSLEAKFNEINAYFSAETKTVASGAPALPFHGFLQILFHLARVKFNNGDDQLMPSFIKLLSHCDAALRRYGVRSSRLRRAELMEEEQQDVENNVGDVEEEEKRKKAMIVKIYLLPSRMPGRRPLEPAKQTNGIGPKRKAATQPGRAKSLPRKLMPATNK